MSHLEKRYNQFISDITENLKTHEIVREYKNNNINKVRLETYKDFIINLCHYIGDTFLGYDIIKSTKDKKNHFKWAFNKVCNDFLEEDIDFKSNDELFDYFFEYFNATLYENEDYSIEFLLEYWEETLEYSYDKTRSDLEGMIEVYNIFERSLENKIKKELLLNKNNGE